MEREVGGGIGMGNTCKPMAVSFQCMTKSTTNKKKKESCSACLSQNGSIPLIWHSIDFTPSGFFPTFLYIEFVSPVLIDKHEA